MIAGCEENPENLQHQLPEGSTIFNPEYDYMQYCDLFYAGDDFVCNAFAPCYTDLQFHYDDELPPQSVRFDGLTFFVYQTSDLEENGEFSYKSYLLSIADAYEKPTGEVLGYTANAGDEGYAFTVIFVDAIDSCYPNDPSMIEKTTVHELGHMRADLPHLCFDTYPTIQNSFHNSSSCVMGTGEISTCTYIDLTQNLHFCDSCCLYLGYVNW